MKTGKINIHNYEAYLLDSLEGRLDEATRVELEIFLRNNPDVDSFSDTNLAQLSYFDSDNLQSIYLYSEQLKKEKPSPEYDKLLFLEIENELTEEASVKLHRDIQNDPILAAHYRIWKDTRLFPDQQLELSKEIKSSLKKTRNILPWAVGVAAAAIIIALLFSPTLLNITKQNTSNNSVANNLKVIHESPVGTREENFNESITALNENNETLTLNENKKDRNVLNKPANRRVRESDLIQTPESGEPNSIGMYNIDTSISYQITQPALTIVKIPSHLMGKNPDPILNSAIKKHPTTNIHFENQTIASQELHSEKQSLFVRLNMRINQFFSAKSQIESQAGAALAAIDEQGLIGLMPERDKNGKIQAFSFRLANKTWKQSF